MVLEVADNGPGMAAEVASAHLRALLHHQAAGRRHRRRAVGLPRHRRRAWRRASSVDARPATARASACACRSRRRDGRAGGGGAAPAVPAAGCWSSTTSRRSPTWSPSALGTRRPDRRHRRERARALARARGRRRSTPWSATCACPTWTAPRWPTRSGRRWPELAGRILLITGDALGADPSGRLVRARPADPREAARPRGAARPRCSAGSTGERNDRCAGAHPGRRRRARPARAAEPTISGCRASAVAAAADAAPSSTPALAEPRPT